jgi:hypothetical protein
MFAFAGRFGAGKSLACADLLVLANDSGVAAEDLLFVDPEGGMAPYMMEPHYKGKFTLKEVVDPADAGKLITDLQKGEKKYKIIVVDPVEFLQDQIVQETWEDPNLSTPYKEKNTSFMWGRVKKDLAKQILRLRTRCEVLGVTSHARREFVAAKPTGRFEPKFLDPIWYACDFVALLNRRLNHQFPDASFMPPIGKARSFRIPPSIEDFSWTKLLKYMTEEPVDWKKLKKEEMASEGLELLNKLEKIVGTHTEGGEEE